MSSLISRTLLGMIADFNSAVVWMNSILLLISNSLFLFSRFFCAIPRVPSTIGIIVTLMYHSLFFLFFSLNSLARSILFAYLFAFLCFYSIIRWDGKIHQMTIFIYLFVNSRFGLLTGIGWSVYISKSQRTVCVLFSRTVSSLCIYPNFK